MHEFISFQISQITRSRSKWRLFRVTKCYIFPRQIFVFLNGKFLFRTKPFDPPRESTSPLPTLARLSDGSRPPETRARWALVCDVMGWKAQPNIMLKRKTWWTLDASPFFLFFCLHIILFAIRNCVIPHRKTLFKYLCWEV